MSITISVPRLTALLNGSMVALKEADAAGRVTTIDLPHTLKRRGVEAKLIVGNGRDGEPNPDSALIGLIAKAHHWLDALTNGGVASIADLAVRENEDRNEISRFLPLAFLAPDIIEKILKGTQPVDLTIKKLRDIGTPPHAWHEQRAALGFID